MHDASASDQQDPADHAEFQFLGAEERAQAGDTQALAPATEEQARQGEAAHREEMMEEDGEGGEGEGGHSYHSL